MTEIQTQLRYSVPEAAIMLRVGVATIWRRIAAGQIQVVRDGGRTFITYDELHKYATRGAPRIKAS